MNRENLCHSNFTIFRTESVEDDSVSSIATCTLLSVIAQNYQGHYCNRTLDAAQRELMFAFMSVNI